MTTLQEAAKRAIGHLMDRQRSLSSDSNTRLHAKKVIDDLRTALAQQGEQAKPVAYITQTEQGDMVWTPEMYGEACTYCDDDEFPVPLYTQPAQMRILTDEQIKYMWAQYCSYPGGILDFARAIREAA